MTHPQFGLFPVVEFFPQKTISGVEPGDITLHPGPNGEACIVRWTTPPGIHGTIFIKGEFKPGDKGKMNVAVCKNGKWNVPLWKAVDSGSFDLKTTVHAKDTIDFVVYGGGFYSGSTPLDVKISAKL